MISRSSKLLSAVLLFALLTLSVVTPAYAFDGRGGDKVVIQTGEVINDDLYVGANEIVLDGTVNGDAVAFGQIVTVNGTVHGDLITAAQTVVVNGTVTGNIRMAGQVLFVGDKARIGGDILGAGYSLEIRQGSTIGRDAVFATGQTLLAANVGRNVIAYAGGLEIKGDVAGNVKAQIGEAGQSQSGPPPSVFMGQSTVPVPIVRQGLTIDPEAKISGNLEYTQNADLSIPAGVVAGKVTRTVQPEQRRQPSPEESAALKVANWVWASGRSLISLILVGLFLLWLFPLFTTSASDQLQRKPWPSLGWGVVVYAGFFFVLLLVTFVMILGAILFGVLTLGGLSATIVGLGLLALFALIVAFALATSFVAKVVFGVTLGRWILARLNSPIASHRYWPMVIGVAITVAVVALLKFPLVPGVLGGLLDFAIILFGLGALWIRVREGLSRKPAPTPA
ncbi:MAG TPA: polymer-forming cytoskeletal protein [Anaerolineales bacterium]